MKWYEDLPQAAQTEINMLTGSLNLPKLNDYESLHHFLHDVRSKITEAKYLTRQASNILGI